MSEKVGSQVNYTQYRGLNEKASMFEYVVPS